MRAKVIKSDAEYAAALKEVEALWDAAPGTREVETAELWTVLIEAYEKKAYPMGMPDPVSAIRFRMEHMRRKPTRWECRIRSARSGSGWSSRI